MKQLVIKFYNTILSNATLSLAILAIIASISFAIGYVLDKYYGISLWYFLPLIIGPMILTLALLELGRYLESKEGNK